MKRTLLFMVILLAMFVGFAGAAPMTLTVMTNGVTGWLPNEDFRGYEGIREKLAADFEKANPGVRVTILYRDVKQGSMTVDALMAAGTPPDLWLDAAGYFKKYMNAEYALDLGKYVNLSLYHDYLLKPYQVNGKQYALPYSNVLGGFAVNATMLAEVGYTLPDPAKWTTDEFLALGAKLKAKGYPLTMLDFKGGMSGWSFFFLRAFGAEMYDSAKKDYSKVTINSPAALAGLEYIKKLISLGYAYPNAVEQDDNAAVELFTTYKVASSSMQDGHCAYWIPQQLATGKIKSKFEVRFVSFPHAPGLPNTKIYGYQSIMVGHKSDDEARNRMIGELAELFSGREFTFYSGGVSCGFSVLKGYEPSIGWAATSMHTDLAGLGQTVGLVPADDVGDKGAEVDRLWATMTESWIRNKVDSKTMLANFEKQANAILAK
jgi:ABC-type glycerol-3-phosphate transport system substrate-binding protein